FATLFLSGANVKTISTSRKFLTIFYQYFQYLNHNILAHNPIHNIKVIHFFGIMHQSKKQSLKTKHF
ncbi:hypothetical protein, partial [Kaistella chaponensis]|uniref:hypothetical protein n=1 Tax=Kaistella chaponensis TaxID=713588 RepID=UPI001C879408